VDVYKVVRLSAALKLYVITNTPKTAKHSNMIRAQDPMALGSKRSQDYWDVTRLPYPFSMRTINIAGNPQSSQDLCNKPACWFTSDPVAFPGKLLGLDADHVGCDLYCPGHAICIQHELVENELQTYHNATGLQLRLIALRANIRLEGTRTQSGLLCLRKSIDKIGGRDLRRRYHVVKFVIPYEGHPQVIVRMKLKIQLGSSVHDIEIAESAKGIDLKEEIENSLRVLVRTQKLIFKGKVVNDKEILSERSIKDGSKVLLLATASGQVILFDHSIQVPIRRTSHFLHHQIGGSERSHVLSF
jgi:Ubiquitin family